MKLWETIKNNEIVYKIVEFIAKYTNVKPVLENLNSAKAIQKTISIILQIFAVFIGLGLLFIWFGSWRLLNQFDFFGGLGILVWQLAFLYVGFFIIKILFQRAKEITDLPKSEYIITPIIALMMVTYGEVIFIFLAMMSVPAMLTVWFAGSSLLHGSSSIGYLLSELNVLNPGNIFLAGIGVFVMSWVTGFLTLVFTRLFTEFVLALVSIAKDASILRIQSADKKK
jgi:hypothetical protein